MIEKLKENKLMVSAIAVAVLAIVVSGVALYKVNKGLFGAFASSQSNEFFTATVGATTTHASLPVKVLSKNRNRIYASIVNDSDTALYLHFGAYDDPLAASTSVNVNEGIRLNASGGSYEILPENAYMGEVWATSTAPSKTILTIEK